MWAPSNCFEKFEEGGRRVRDTTGRVVLIVGASSGIGRASARLFAQGGDALVLASRDEAKLEALRRGLAAESDAPALVVPTDATDAGAVGHLIGRAVEEFGRVDTLVYAAGVGTLKPFAETTVGDFERLMRVNVFGAFNACQAVLPVMERQKSGRVVAIPGILGRAPMSQAAAYCASKYALTGLLKSLALETKRAGVRFSLLHLGGVNSPFWDDITMRVQRERMLTIEAAARAVHFAATQEGEGVLGELTLQPESHQM
jgi:NAD(P)-dependent dehydrogenase (short-subunit alcohol dehydrogenase family)